MAAVTPTIYPQQAVAPVPFPSRAPNPRVYAARPPQSNNFIVFLLMGVIAFMVFAFMYITNKNSKDYKKKIKQIEEKTKRELAKAKTEEEKREVQRKASYAKERAKMERQMKSHKEQLKRAEARVESEMKKAGEQIGEAKKLKEEAAKEKAYADLKAKEAEEAQKKAQETNDANAKKLAEEKKRLAEEAQKKVAEAEKKANEAIALAKKEAEKAIKLKKRVEEAEKKVKKNVKKPKKEREFMRVKIYSHGPGSWYGTRPCGSRYCWKHAAGSVFRLYRFNGKKPQHFLLANDNNIFCKGAGRIKCDSRKASFDESAYKKDLVFTVKRTEATGPGNKHNLHLFAVNDKGEEKGCGLAGPQGRWQCPGRMPKYRIDKV